MQAVADGVITQAQADQILQGNGHRFCGPHGRDGRGGPGGKGHRHGEGGPDREFDGNGGTFQGSGSNGGNFQNAPTVPANDA